MALRTLLIAAGSMALVAPVAADPRYEALHDPVGTPLGVESPAAVDIQERERRDADQTFGDLQAQAAPEERADPMGTPGRAETPPAARLDRQEEAMAPPPGDRAADPARRDLDDPATPPRRAETPPATDIERQPGERAQPTGDWIGDTARATTELNLRSGPGTEHHPVAVIPARAEVEVHACLDGRVWCQVSYGGTVGYASDRYLTPS